jgi:hypothetical protein
VKLFNPEAARTATPHKSRSAARSRLAREGVVIVVRGRTSRKQRLIEAIAAQVASCSPEEVERLDAQFATLQRVLKRLAGETTAGSAERLVEPEPASRSPDTGADRQEALQGEPLRRIRTAAERETLEAALATAEARGAGLAADILRRPQMLTAEGMAKRLGVTRDTVNRWRDSGRLLGLSGAKRGYRYPAWQVDVRGRILPGLDALLCAVSDPWAAYRWLTLPHPELGGLTGLEALQRGRAQDLVEASARFGETFG